MELLKLAALDADDLAVISAHLQDALLCPDDLGWLPDKHRFALVARRFDRSVESDGRPRRRLVGVHFERVLGVKAKAIAPGAGDVTLSLLAITFESHEPPSGIATLVFSGGAAIRLELECVEVRMRDLGPVWVAKSCPDHELDDDTVEARRITLSQ